MERLNETTVVVYNFSAFRDVLSLEENKSVTMVYLANDIKLTEPVKIYHDRTTITIDGISHSVTGNRCTLTDYFSKDFREAFGLKNDLGIEDYKISMTVQNMNIIGYNYHGILYVPWGWDYRGVTVNYHNVNYTGPQMTYNPIGLTRYFNVNFTSEQGASDTQEMGEVSRVEMRGEINITHSSPYITEQNKPVFTFWGNILANDSLTISEGAKVTIKTENSFMACKEEGKQAVLEVKKGATLDIETNDTVCHELNDIFSSIMVRENADVRIIQKQSNDVMINNLPSINCGTFSVEKEAQVRIAADFNTMRPLLRFVPGGSLSLNEPKRFVLYNRNVNAITFLEKTSVLIRGGQVNRWINAKTPFKMAGGLDNIPPYSWRKTDGSAAYIKATIGNDGTPIIDESNFTLEELKRFQFDFTQVFSVGELPIVLNPMVTDGRPITGTTTPLAAIIAKYTFGDVFEVLGAADASGSFSLNTPQIPEGTEVAVISNLDFLYSELKDTVRDPGTLELLFAPEFIPYLAEKISTTPVLYGRKEPDFHVTVSDTRVDSDVWYLYCVLKKPVTGEKDDRPIPCFLVFADPQGDGLHTLGETKLLVYTGEKDEAKPTKDISWAANKGLLMQATGAPFFNKEEYKAEITWILSDTPLSD